MTNLIPMFEFLTLDDAAKAKAKAFVETVDPTIDGFGVIVRDNRPLEWLVKVLPDYLYAKLKLVGYKTTAEDFTKRGWPRWFKMIDLTSDAHIFFDHEHALKTILDHEHALKTILDYVLSLCLTDYGDFLEALATMMPLGPRVIHYPGVVRSESEAYQRLYGGLSIAAANAGALVCDSSLGYATPVGLAGQGSGQTWIATQNAVSRSIRSALIGAHGSHVIAPMLYTRDVKIAGWPMKELPRLEVEFAELGYGPTMVHLGWGKLLELGEEWLKVFDAAK